MGSGADRSFVQWQGRGPTNRRRGFDSLSSDRRHEPPHVRLSRSTPDRAACGARPVWGHLELRTSFVAFGFLPRSKVVSRPLKPVMLVRFQLGEPYGGRGVLECTPRCERGGAGSIPAGHPDCIYIESADEWSSTGPENRGGGDEPQRFDSSALVPGASRNSALSANGRRPGPQPGNGGFNSPQRHARPLRLEGSGSPAFIRETRVRIPQRSPRPRRLDRGQRYERRLWGFESSRGYGDVLEW